MTAERSTVIRDGQAGITLIEMLVSLVIFALVGLASFTMLDTLLNVQDRTEGRLETLANIDRALLVFSNDMMQSDPATLALDDDGLAVRVGAARQHDYRLIDGVLMRIVKQDNTDAPALEQALVPDVQGVTFAVLDPSDVWQPAWPTSDGFAASRAVRMTMELDTAVTITRIVPLPATLVP